MVAKLWCHKLCAIFLDHPVYKCVLIDWQEKYAIEIGLNDRDMIPIFVSIAQTLSDLKKYDEAVAYFMKELDRRHGEHKQVKGSFICL